MTNIANTAKDKLTTDAITEFEVRILILESSYTDLIKAGNKHPFRHWYDRRASRSLQPANQDSAIGAVGSRYNPWRRG